MNHKKFFLLALGLWLTFFSQNTLAQQEFWGMTNRGGIDFLGTIFKTDVNGTGLIVQKSFTTSFSGARPTRGQLTLAPNGKFYGLTSQGGSNDQGVLFEFDPTTNTYSKKLDFLGASNGAYPYASLVLFSNGKLYGTTDGGGSSGVGTLFEYDATTNIYVKKIDFSNTNGSNPRCELAILNDKLFGLTYGGGANGLGVIFEYKPSTNEYTKKVDFNGTTMGANPEGSLILTSNGKLYGMTYGGGLNGMGVLFEYAPLTNTYVKKKDFSGNTTGGNPLGSLVEYPSGKVYGMTYSGGNNNKGVLFEYDLLMDTYSKKVDFSNSDGANPQGNLTVSNNGKFYGMTQNGGSSGYGVLFEYDPLQDIYSKKINFTSDVNGYLPLGSLSLSSNGKLFGMTSYGGTNNQGVIFDYNDATNTYTKKIDFNFSPNGSLPTGNLTQFPNGKFYGMASGGNNNLGILFEYDPSTNVYSKKIDFAGLVNGAQPFGSLTFNSNFKLYGMTYKGGINDAGVLFEYDPMNNAIIKKVDFSAASTGAFPYGDLSNASNGKLYGMTYIGGVNSSGVLFEYDPIENRYTKKFDFNGTVTGAGPQGGILQASNGKLYGMTSNGGANDKGTLFEYDISNDLFTKRLDFDGPTNGANPYASLTQSSNGKLYGMTVFGGLNGQGTLFEFDPITNIFSKKFNFSINTTGAFPYGNLVQSSNGKLYGMAGGGSEGKGVLFEYNPSSNQYSIKSEFNGSNGAYPGASLLFTKNIQTITFNSLPLKSYGDGDFSLTASASSGLAIQYISSDPSIASITGNSVSILTAGSVTITASQSGNDNTMPAFSIQQTLVVQKAPLTVTADNKTRVYGNIHPTLSFAYSGFKGSDDTGVIDASPTITTPAIGTSNVGTYPITVSGGSDNNYSFIFIAGSLIIDKAPLLAAADDKIRFYGDLNPDFTISYSGFKGIDNAGVINNPPNASTTATLTSEAGDYSILLSGGIDDNYSFEVLTSGTIHVIKAILTAIADSKEKLYGDTNPSLSISYTGFKGSDNNNLLDIAPSIITAAVETSDAGSYPIHLSGGADNNYALTLVDGILTINKAILTITPNDVARVYGDANPIFEANYSGFRGNDDLSLIDTKPVASTIATQISEVGEYPIVMHDGLDNNYDFAFTTGILTVNKSALTVKANDITRDFGDINPILSLVYNGFKGTDDESDIDTPPTTSTVATQESNTGIYQITLSGGIDNNYAIEILNEGTLTIVKANQVISFESLNTKTIGDDSFSLGASASSGLTVKYSYNSDKLSILDNQVTLLLPGLATITAFQEGNSNFKSAPSVQQNFCINPSKPRITVENANSDSPVLTSSSLSGNQWYLNNISISGSNSKTHVAKQGGSYTVQVKIDECLSEFSNESNLVVTGDIKAFGNYLPQVYPSPAEEWVVVSLGNLIGEKEISIYQMDGKKTDSQKVSGGEVKFNVAGYPTGIYLIKIKDKTLVKTIRFLKR